MRCTEIQHTFDDFLDGQLSDHDRSAVTSHLAECDACKTAMEAERKFRQMLKESPVPEPDPGFTARVMRRVSDHQKAPARKYFVAGFVGATAASLVMLLVAGILFRGFGQGASVERITLSLNEPRNIQLVFNATEDVAHATMVLELPAHLELQGYPGRTQLAWETSLRKGANSLILPIVAHEGKAGELIARVVYGDKEKVFHIRQEISTQDSTQNVHVDTDIV